MSESGKESSLPPLLPEEEDLPPGVRKHNRCHSSGSSDSEDEPDEKKKPIDVNSSDSESDKSEHGSSKKDVKKRDSSQRDAAESKSESKEKEVSSKAGRSRSRSDSRSKSRSRSRSPKRRKSSEKSRRSRSRSRDRRHRRDRKHRSHGSRSKERRRSRDRHRHKKDRRRSHSRSRSRDRDRRDRRYSRDRDRRRRDRRDSRSPSPHDGKVIKFGNKVIKPGASFGRPSSNFSKPITFKEKMRQQLIKAIEEGADTNEVLANKGSTICTQSAGVQQQSVPKPKGPPVPLMDTILPSTATLAAMTVSASDAAMQSMLALQKEATEKTGIEIPKYYNPAAINPMKYAEQVQKRKLLWSKAKDKDVNSQWHATSLSGDADDKSKEKFRKLMGIKNDPISEEGEKEEKQKQLFDQLNKEYEYARMATHTHRGIGLGFSSTSGYPQQSSSIPPQPPQPPSSTG